MLQFRTSSEKTSLISRNLQFIFEAYFLCGDILNRNRLPRNALGLQFSVSLCQAASFYVDWVAVPDAFWFVLTKRIGDFATTAQKKPRVCVLETTATESSAIIQYALKGNIFNDDRRKAVQPVTE